MSNTPTIMRLSFYVIIAWISCLSMSCQPSAPEITNNFDKPLPALDSTRLNAAFLIMDGVYNTEFTAPFDIFQHTVFREGIRAMNVFVVADTRDPIRTFEGLYIYPDFDYTNDELPRIDILVVPSAEHHLDTDLENETMIDFVRSTGENAEYVISLCDGAFVLAKAGLLDGKKSTTFPSDQDQFEQMFPATNVIRDVSFVHDGKFITSVGGAKSFDPALYLSEVMYGEEVARRLAQGLVIDWKLDSVKLKIED